MVDEIRCVYCSKYFKHCDYQGKCDKKINKVLNNSGSYTMCDKKDGIEAIAEGLYINKSAGGKGWSLVENIMFILGSDGHLYHYHNGTGIKSYVKPYEHKFSYRITEDIEKEYDILRNSEIDLITDKYINLRGC